MDDEEVRGRIVSESIYNPEQNRFKIILVILVLVAIVIAVSIIYYQKIGLFSQKSGDLNELGKGNAKNTATIFVTDSGFNPSTLTIKKGSTVTWFNKDNKVHQVSAGSLSDIDLRSVFGNGEPLYSGESFSYTFEEKGKYRYFDFIFPRRAGGVVIVE